MSVNYEVRYAVGPNEAKKFCTDELRSAFLAPELFRLGEINFIYTHYDRFLLGGVVPLESAIELETIDPLKSEYFLSRRELGIINIGDEGKVVVDGKEYSLASREALYIGAGDRKVSFYSKDQKQPAKFYLNSAAAYKTFPDKKVTLSDARVLDMGSLETANKRTISQLIVRGVVETCQLQMGLTALSAGSTWNTMPAHQHDRRMEAYLYFDLPADHAIAHFMGQPNETRVLWASNEQAVISPPWSIHSGSGTSNYTFIWGMAGENLDYDDMDKYLPSELK